MPAITLPDKSVRRFDGPVTGTTVAEAIGPGLARAALAVRSDGALRDLASPLRDESSISIVTAKSDGALALIRHEIKK